MTESLILFRSYRSEFLRGAIEEAGIDIKKYQKGFIYGSTVFDADITEIFEFKSHGDMLLAKMLFEKGFCENLSCRDSSIEIPDNTEVLGYADLSHTKISKLPKNFKVKENLYLNYSRVYFLPKCLEVGGDIIFEDWLRPKIVAFLNPRFRHKIR